ncbi:interferon lambda receptor 1 [Clarias gariepinus]
MGISEKYENETGTITLSHLDANTEYCGVVYYKLTHPSIKGQSENTTFCRTLPAAAKPWIPVFIVSGLVAVFLLITFALILCQQYVTRKRNLPKALIMSINPPPIFKLEPKLEITNVKVYPASQWNGKKSDLALPDVLRKSKAVSPAGYAAQDYRNQDWHSHSYTNEQVGPVSGQSARSSTSYSMVLGRKETWDRGQSSCDIDSGLGDSISPDLSSLTEEDLFQVTPPAEPGKDLGMIKPDSLMLPVSRGVNGKLAFFGLEFPNSEITPLAASGERTLLLTDLVSLDESNWPDNGSSLDYRKSYLPNGVPPSCLEIHSTETISKVLLSDFTANYRENWVPGILPDPLEYNRKCIISDIICDNQLHELVEPEQNVGESPPQLKANFLGKWMVQIQG